MAVGKKMDATFWCRAAGRERGERAGRSPETTAAPVGSPSLVWPPWSLWAGGTSPRFWLDHFQGLTQCCCYQLRLQLLHSWRHLLQLQVLGEDGAVHRQQSLLPGEAHGEDAEMALQ